MSLRRTTVAGWMSPSLPPGRAWTSPCSTTTVGRPRCSGSPGRRWPRTSSRWRRSDRDGSGPTRAGSTRRCSTPVSPSPGAGTCASATPCWPGRRTSTSPLSSAADPRWEPQRASARTSNRRCSTSPTAATRRPWSTSSTEHRAQQETVGRSAYAAPPAAADRRGVGGCARRGRADPRRPALRRGGARPAPDAAARPAPAARGAAPGDGGPRRAGPGCARGADAEPGLRPRPAAGPAGCGPPGRDHAAVGARAGRAPGRRTAAGVQEAGPSARRERLVVAVHLGQRRTVPTRLRPQRGRDRTLGRPRREARCSCPSRSAARSSPTRAACSSSPTRRSSSPGSWRRWRATRRWRQPPDAATSTRRSSTTASPTPAPTRRWRCSARCTGPRRGSPAG